MKTLGISEFKAKCIEELKKVQRTGEPLLVTLRKRPIATIHPYCETPPRRELGALRGRMTIRADLVRHSFEDEWELEA